MPLIKEFNDQFLKFNMGSPTAFHVAFNIKQSLKKAGYIELDEKQPWTLGTGKYVVSRDSGAIIAFKIGSNETLADGFRMIGGHTDSPCLQLKPNCLKDNNDYIKLTAEIYGGPLLNTWFDRDLSIAGRILIETAEGVKEEVLIDFKKPILNIPSLAIHLNRDANGKKEIHRQKDLELLFSQKINDSLPDFDQILTAQISKQYLDTKPKQILSFDLFCYDTQAPSLFGLEDEFITAGRLDNQLSTFAGLRALIDTDDNHNCMLLSFNHEENGSTSSSGANGTFINSIFSRIYKTFESKEIGIANSFLLSIDNAHANHPNAPEKSDPSHGVKLNYGPVIKINANQRYASNALSVAIFKLIAQNAGLECQNFVMRNDMPCGSTIGPIIAANLGVSSVDIGAASLGMHSIRETTGSKDPFFMYQASVSFFNGNYHR